MKHYFFTSLTSHGLHDLRKKRYKIFEEMWAWGPHGYATPFSLRLKVAEYQGFHMRYTSLLYQHWFCQKLIKGRRLHCFCFHFHLNISAKIRKTTRWIFQICRDCNHKNICIPKLNVLYQISLSEDFKNIFFFIVMSSNHEKMFV